MFEINQRQAAANLRILYPLWMLVGIASLLIIPSQIFIEGDALATTQNILNREFLFRLGIIGSLITQLLFIIIPLFLFYLFYSVHKHYTILMVAFAWISIPITIYNEMNNLEALTVLQDPDQVMQLIELNQTGVIMASIFWGLWLFPLGMLIIKSGYFPKIVGYAVLAAGVGYLLGSFLKLLVPDLSITSYLEILTFGEIVFIFWLLIKGAKLE